MYHHLTNSHKILISGCGGGYDIFCGMDLMFSLIDQGKEVVLSSYSFTDPKIIVPVGEKINQCCFKITKDSPFDEDQYIQKIKASIKKPPKFILDQMEITEEEFLRVSFNACSQSEKIYFPEYKLVKYLYNTYQLNIPMYCFVDSGIKQLIHAYDQIQELEGIDTVILMDGGTDSLMTGIEIDSLGTPYEDISSIIAAYHSNVSNKYLYCLGYNIDSYHGVTDENFLKNTSNLIKDNGFVGSYTINKNNQSTQKYIDTFMHCDPECSIVNSLIVSALEGHFGNYHPDWIQHRLKDSQTNVHPLMCLYWIYKLDNVYMNLKYDVDKLKDTEEEFEKAMLLKLVD